jgi:hypothetical protein
MTHLRQNKWLLGALLASPVVAFYMFFFRFSLNVPWLDDYQIWEFLVGFEQSQDWLTRWKILIQQSNEYRMPWMRIVSWATMHLFGQFNFQILMFIGDLALLGFVFLFVRALRTQTRETWLWVLPLVFLLYQPQTYLKTLWGLPSMQYIPVAFLAISSAYYVGQRGTKHTMLAILFAILATFTFGNGLFAFFVGLLILAFQQRWKTLLGWLLAMAAVVLFYFTDYSLMGNSGKAGDALSHPVRTIFGFFAFIGGLLDVLKNLPNPYARLAIPALAGAFITAWMMYWFSSVLLFGWWPLRFSAARFPRWAKPHLAMQQQPVLATFISAGYLFLGGVALVIAFTRSVEDLHVVVTNTYRIYSPLFFIFTYLSILCVISEKRKDFFGKIFLIFSIFINLYSYFQYLPVAQNRRKMLVTYHFNETTNGRPRAFKSERQRQEAAYKDTLTGFLSTKKHYEYPMEVRLLFKKIVTQPETASPQRPGYAFDIKEVQNGEYQFVNQSFVGPESHQDGLYLVLKSAQNTYVYPALRPYRDLLHLRRGAGAVAVVTKHELWPGTYHVGTCQILNGELKEAQFGSQQWEVK